MREQRNETPQPTGEPAEVDHKLLSDALYGIVEACETFEDQFVFRVNGTKKPITLNIKLPPPMFFYIEHGSPFLLSMLGDEPKKEKVGRTSKREEYNYKIRTCCASVVQPKLDTRTLSRVYPHLVHRLYSEIVDRIMPSNVVKLMRVFYNLSLIHI